MINLKKIAFRFFFVYFILTIAPWLWLSFVPGVSYVIEYYSKAMNWIVTICNENLFHIKKVLNMEGYGSGDTSYSWAEFYTIIILSLIASLIWTAFDRKPKGSTALVYWLHNLIRYNLIFVAFIYGVIKLFGLQMPFPSLSQLATPLGDYLPMRMSWLFIGYSEPYQFFSGMMELTVGFLLLYRKTIPLGLIVGLGVFMNVFVLNMCYDIPVKLYSMQIVICCIFLLAIDIKKYINFFILNKPTIPTTGYNYRFTKKWQRIGRIVLKSAFILLALGLTFYDSVMRYQESKTVETNSISPGVYNIKTFKKNNEIIAVDANDSLSWKDFIFEKEKFGSINTRDTLFRVRYGRGYFNYRIDKSEQITAFKTSQNDTITLFVMKYKFIDKKTLQLQGVFKKDTLYYELVKSVKKFPLADRPFHWISEANR